MLLHCLEEAMKRDGDLKLAAVSPASAIILELMRVDRVFEVFETPEEAARSFQAFGSRRTHRANPGIQPTDGPFEGGQLGQPGVRRHGNIERAVIAVGLLRRVPNRGGGGTHCRTADCCHRFSASPGSELP